MLRKCVISGTKGPPFSESGFNLEIAAVEGSWLFFYPSASFDPHIRMSSWLGSSHRQHPPIFVLSTTLMSGVAFTWVLPNDFIVLPRCTSHFGVGWEKSMRLLLCPTWQESSPQPFLDPAVGLHLEISRFHLL